MNLEQAVPKRKDIEAWLEEAPLSGLERGERADEKRMRVKKRKDHVRKKIEQLKIPESAKQKILSDLDNYPTVRKDLERPVSREV